MNKYKTITKLSTKTIIAISVASIILIALAAGLANESARKKGNDKAASVNFYRTDGDLWAGQTVKYGSKQMVLLALTAENKYSDKIQINSLKISINGSSLDKLSNFRLYKRQRNAEGNTNQTLLKEKEAATILKTSSDAGFLVFKNLDIAINKDQQKEIWLYGDVGENSEDTNYEFRLVGDGDTKVVVMQGKKRSEAKIKIKDADSIIESKKAEKLPTINISSPKDNETYATGQNVAIKWTSDIESSIAPKVPIFIDLIKQNIIEVEGIDAVSFDLIADVVAPTTANDGSEEWTIPDSLDKNSKYYLKVGCLDASETLPNGCLEGTSGFFEIK